jgi:hypothetical protein
MGSIWHVICPNQLVHLSQKLVVSPLSKAKFVQVLQLRMINFTMELTTHLLALRLRQGLKPCQFFSYLDVTGLLKPDPNKREPSKGPEAAASNSNSGGCQLLQPHNRSGCDMACKRTLPGQTKPANVIELHIKGKCWHGGCILWLCCSRSIPSCRISDSRARVSR